MSRREKENLKRLIEGMINERMSYAYERCIQEMCKDEPYARYEYGKLEEIDPITPKQLLQLHSRLLAEAPIDLFVLRRRRPEESRRPGEEALQVREAEDQGDPACRHQVRQRRPSRSTSRSSTWNRARWSWAAAPA